MPLTCPDVVNPNSPFGYILMENDTTFKEVSNVNVYKDEYLFFIRFNTILQSLDCVNRNNRWYKGDAVWESLNTSEVKELQANKKLQSEMGHPINQPPDRIATIDETRTCNIILKMWRDGNLIRGEMETLDDGMWGTKLTKMILQGINPSYSYRGFAVLTKKGNIVYVYQPPRFITYDEVVLPSHKEAYADPKKTKIAKSYNGSEHILEASVQTPPVGWGVKEPTPDPIMETIAKQTNGRPKDFSRPLLASDIQEMLMRDSDNAKSVCESLGIDPSTLSLYGNHSMSVKSGSDTIVFQSERSVARKYADLWRKF